MRRIILLLILFPAAAQTQSLAEAAKQQRARLCKEGTIQYCDDRAKKNKSKIVVDEQGSSGEGEAQGAPAPESSQALPTVGELQDRLDELRAKTPRQLADEVVGGVQFPGRDRWEVRLTGARDKSVSKIQVVLDLLRTDKPDSSALKDALFEMKMAGSDYRDLQTDGVSKAADWKRKTADSTSSKSEPKQPR